MTISSVYLAVLLLLFIAVSPVRSLNVLSQRVDVPKPDGSGVVFVQLQADPSDPNFNLLNGFNITSTNFINAEQALRLWNSAEGNCQGSFISIDSPASQVPKDGMLCFFSNTSTGPLEFENSFTFVALGDSNPGNVGSVTFLNYNKQLCTGIPDLGSPSSITAPPEPTVNIRLAGLEIQFTVTATYLRNQTAWFLDFWNFNSAAGGDSINGAASTCTNQVAANHQGSFSSWWYSAPRATYNHGVDASIDDALDDVIYPNYDPSGSRWSITAIDCSTVQYQTTIPVSNLVMNSTSDCHKTGSIASAATTTGGLQYFGTLYANALRPIDSSSASAGYFRSTFAFPFSFSLQTTVSSIVGTSSKWNFVVSVLNSLVTFDGQTPNFMLQLQTSISSPSATSPNVDASGFQVVAMPLSSLHTASFAPTLSRILDNGQCGVGSSQACIITWQMVLPQLPQGDFSNLVDFDTQYVGKYSFQWTTTSGRRDVRAGDVLEADIYVDVSAANPATNLSQVPINSSLSFFSDQASMQTTSNAGMAVPQYESGERIWVRHSFLVDPQDIQAFIFNLTHAYICTSNVPGFVPSVANGQTGCSQDIPGVMELSQGQRFVLFDVNTLPGGIADIHGNASAGQHDTIWGWEQILPSDPSWTGASTVNNGFSINALPLAQENSQTTWYFHLISQVSQTPLTRRGANNNNNNSRRGSNIVHYILRASSTPSSPESPALQGVTIASASSSSSDANSIASSSLFAHLKDALLW